jgi:hypothetical protein
MARATNPEQSRTRPATATARKLLEANSSRIAHQPVVSPCRTERLSLCTVKPSSAPQPILARVGVLMQHPPMPLPRARPIELGAWNHRRLRNLVSATGRDVPRVRWNNGLSLPPRAEAVSLTPCRCSAPAHAWQDSPVRWRRLAGKLGGPAAAGRTSGLPRLNKGHHGNGDIRPGDQEVRGLRSAPA